MSKSNQETIPEPSQQPGDAIAATTGAVYFGRWTRSEEAYANTLISGFQAGTLEGVEDGATLRNYLAEKLTCQAKRISKKYEGSHYNGRQRFFKKKEILTEEELEEKRSKLLEQHESFVEARKKARKPNQRKKTVKKEAPPARNTAGTTGLQQPNFNALDASSTTTSHDAYNRMLSNTMAELAATQRLAAAPQAPPAMAGALNLQQQQPGSTMWNRMLSNAMEDMAVRQRLSSALQAPLASGFAGGGGGASFGSNQLTGLGLGLQHNPATAFGPTTGIGGLLPGYGAPPPSFGAAAPNSDYLAQALAGAGNTNRYRELLLAQQALATRGTGTNTDALSTRTLGDRLAQERALALMTQGSNASYLPQTNPASYGSSSMWGSETTESITRRLAAASSGRGGSGGEEKQQHEGVGRLLAAPPVGAVGNNLDRAIENAIDSPPTVAAVRAEITRKRPVDASPGTSNSTSSSSSEEMQGRPAKFLKTPRDP